MPIATGQRARGRDAEDGASAVEFAFILIPFITLIFGVIQYGWYFYTAQSTSSAARETARRLVVGDCQSSGAAQSYAQRQANVNSLTLQFGPPHATDPQAVAVHGTLPPEGSVVRVVVTANGHIVGFLPMPNSGQVTRVVEALVEDAVPGPVACS